MNIPRGNSQAMCAAQQTVTRGLLKVENYVVACFDFLVFR
jgi:hypothetical protein